MDKFLDMGSIALRSLFSVITLFIISRVIGPRQISQLTFYDYIVGITIGSVAATAVDSGIPFSSIVISMVVFGLFTELIELLTNKSFYLRSIFSGKPTIIIYKGKIIKKAMKKHKYDISDLLQQCRLNGYFDIADIEYAIMETNGQISILPKAEQRPVVAKDVNAVGKNQQLKYSIIIDGKILTKNLLTCGKDEAWLYQKLTEQNINDLSEVLFACWNKDDDTVTTFLQNEVLPEKDECL